MPDITAIIEENAEKQKGYIVQVKSVLYDLARQEEQARRRRREGETELAAMLARLDTMQSLLAEAKKGDVPAEVPEPLRPAPASTVIPMRGKGDAEGGKDPDAATETPKETRQ
jgi:hypothetical protein